MKFVLGLIIGSILGVICMALIKAGSEDINENYDNDDYYYDDYKEDEDYETN